MAARGRDVSSLFFKGSVQEVMASHRGGAEGTARSQLWIKGLVDVIQHFLLQRVEKPLLAMMKCSHGKGGWES